MGKFIFELSGVPGSGKTTLVDRLTKSFPQYDILIDYQFYRKQHKYLNKVRTISFWLMGKDKEAKKILAKMRKECVQRRDRGIHLKKQLNYIRCICLYRQFGSNFNIAISEGIFQALLELMDTVKRSKENVAIVYCAELYRLFIEEFSYVNILVLKLDYIKANSRVNHRNDKRNSVDKLREEERIFLLEKRCRNMEILLNVIDTNESKIHVLYADNTCDDVYGKFIEIIGRMGGYNDL